MKTILRFGVLALLIGSCGPQPGENAKPPSLPPSLPQHTMAKNSPLALHRGRRIEIHVADPYLTKEQCVALINAYRSQAGPGGQVSVRKPDKYGDMSPWCVDNLDGTPIVFNTFGFR